MVNPDNLTPDHADKAIAKALKKFDAWEKVVNLENPEPTDHLYRDYQIARDYAQQVAGLVNWRIQDAKNLP